MPVLACRVPPWHQDQVQRSPTSALWLLLGTCRLSSRLLHRIRPSRAVNLCAEATGRCLVAALGGTLRPKQIAKTLTAKVARRYDPVMRYDPATTAPSSGAADLTTPRQPRQNLVASPAVSFSKFRSVKIGQADLNPLVRVGCPADAEAIAVSNISNRSSERFPIPRRKASLAWVGPGYRGRR